MTNSLEGSWLLSGRPEGGLWEAGLASSAQRRHASLAADGQRAHLPERRLCSEIRLRSVPAVSHRGEQKGIHGQFQTPSCRSEGH